MTKHEVTILNCPIHNLNQQELLDDLTQGVVVTPNIDHLMRLQKDKNFYRLYQQADYRVCDSRIIFLLCKLFYPNNHLKAQITGSDLFPAFCNYHKSNQAISIFLLGGSEESVAQAAKNINKNNGRDIVCSYYSPPFGFEKSENENKKIIDLINQSQANVLAVGVGSPKQEHWIFDNKDKLKNITIHFAIGASIEFQSGSLKRSPPWMTKMGIEWLYRLCQEPKRLAKRYLVDDLPFLWHYTKQRLGFYKNPWQ